MRPRPRTPRNRSAADYEPSELAEAGALLSGLLRGGDLDYDAARDAALLPEIIREGAEDNGQPLNPETKDRGEGCATAM